MKENAKLTIQKSRLNKYFLPAHSFAFLIFIAASIPTGAINKIRESKSLFALLLSDFSLHSGFFGVFTALLCYGFYKVRGRSLPFLKIGLISFAFGLFIEFYQAILPHRSFALNDLGFDLVGIFIILIISKITIWI
ncbi:MAG: VanZ family protein [Candidatus Aminicenantaceae bacterium]